MKIRFKDITGTINTYGYSYSFKKYLFSMFLVLGAVVGISLFYELDWKYIILIGGISLFCITPITLAQFEQMYRMRQFSEVDAYLHQMIYSFLKLGKINVALQDTYKVSEGRLRETVGKAIDIIENSTSEYLYEDALSVIEKEYPCDKIVTLHKFLISVERRGGTFKSSINVLLGDFDRWITKTYKKQQDLIKFKANASVGIVVCMLIGALTIIMSKVVKTLNVGLEMNISGDMMYQVSSVMFIIVCILYVAFVQCHYKGQWLTKVRHDDTIVKDYKMAFIEDIRDVRKKSLPVVAFFLVIGIIMFVINTLLTQIIGGICIGTSLFLLLSPKLNKNAAKKKVTNDAYDGFSEWLRDVAINLQEEPIQSAIFDTYDTCPVVMKASLTKFINEIMENPTAVEPYYDFMSEFGISDITSIVKVLYSIDELDNAKIDETINTLIERNYSIMDRHEEIKYQDEIAVRNYAQYITGLFISAKIGIDMIVMMNTLI